MIVVSVKPNLLSWYPKIRRSATNFGTVGIYCEAKTDNVSAVTHEVIIQLGKLLLASKYF